MGRYHIRPVFQDGNFEYVTDVAFQIQAFRTYIEVTKATIEIDIRNKIAEYERILREDHEVFIETGFDYREMDILRHTSSLYYSSIFIAISSFLERKMFHLCQIAQGKHAIKLGDLSGTGIYKYHNYLTKVAGVDLSEIEDQWRTAVSKAKFRNRIIHEPDVREIQLPDNKLSVEVLDEYLTVVSRILNYIVYEASA